MNEESPESTGSEARQSRLRVLSLVALALVSFFAIRHGWPEAGMPPGSDPEMVKTGLAILVFAAVLWFSEAIPLSITALLVPVLASLTGVFDVAQSFSSFGHPLMFLFLGGFALAAALARHGLDHWIGRGAVRMGRGRFYPTALTLFAITAGLSMWISNTATTAILVPVVLGIRSSLLKQVSEESAKRITLFLLLGIAYSASVGGIGSLIGTVPNAIAAEKLGYSFNDWLKVGFPCAVILLPVLWLLLVVLCRPGRVPDFSEADRSPPLTRDALVTLAIFLATLVGWFFSRPLAAYFGVAKSFDALVPMVSVAVLAALRLVSWKEIEKRTEWGVLLLFGGGLTLSKVLGVSGTSLYLAGGIQAATEGWGLLPFTVVLVLFVIFLTELTSNTATTALLVPIFAAVAVDMGVPESKLVLPIAVAASCAFMLPIATPPNAIVFASGRVRQRQMMRVGVVINVVFVAVLAVLARFVF